MRIIAFGDIHMATTPLESIPSIRDADLLLINGDLTNYGSKKDVKQVLNEILTYNSNVLAQLGNLDNYEINEYLDQLDINLHGKAYLYQNKVCLIGVGGSNITPFNTPTEYTEDQLEVLLAEAHDQAMEFIALAEPLVKTKIPMVLISHTPPLDTKVDKIWNGKHVGSLAVRKYIEKHQPPLCITGHIHEGKGEDSIGKSHIINHGMFRHNSWVDIRIENSKVTATLQ